MVENEVFESNLMGIYTGIQECSNLLLPTDPSHYWSYTFKSLISNT